MIFIPLPLFLSFIISTLYSFVHVTYHFVDICTIHKEKNFIREFAYSIRRITPSISVLCTLKMVCVSHYDRVCTSR